MRPEESPVTAAVRETREETSMEAEIVDLVGIYRLTGDACGQDMPDLLMHVFRGQARAGEATVNAPGRIARLSWHDPDDLPEPVTAVTRSAIADATAARSGVLRLVHRDTAPHASDAWDEPALSGSAG